MSSQHVVNARVKHEARDRPTVQFGFHRVPAGIPPTAQNHRFIASLAELDPALAERLTRLVSILMNHEDALFEWLTQSEMNARDFAKNPVEALQKAVPGLKPGLIEDLKKLAEDISNASGGKK